MTIKLSSLKDRCFGRQGFVLGGGPSLENDLARLHWNGGSTGNGPVLIAVNYHAYTIGIKPHYMVYNDDPDRDPSMWEMVKSAETIRVSPHKTSDIEFDIQPWTGFYSSNTAAWFALWLGCNPVILCGMDCYVGPVKHCHPDHMDDPAWHYPLDDHLRPWREEGLHRLPHIERVRVASGPLSSIFPLYNPREERQK